MEKRIPFWLLFVVTLVLDIIVVPAIGMGTWFPTLTIAFLPIAARLKRAKTRNLVFIVAAILGWLTTGINLGIVVFTLGTLYFYERWFIYQYFRGQVWQTYAVSAVGILFSGIVGALLLHITQPFGIEIRITAIIHLLLTTLTSFIFMLVFTNSIKQSKDNGVSY